MLQKSITGVTKDTVRFTKPIGGILIVTNQTVNGLNGATTGVSNETIGITLESGQEQYKLVSPKMNLLQLAVMATVGEGFILTEGKDVNGQPTSVSLFIPIAPATLDFEDAAELVVSLEGLKSPQVYEVFGIESPGLTNTFYNYSHTKLLAGRTTDQLKLSSADMFSISKLVAVSKMDLTKVSVDPRGEARGTNHKYENAEIKHLIAQTNDLVFGGTIKHGPYFQSLVLPVSMITEADIETDGTELDIILRKPQSL